MKFEESQKLRQAIPAPRAFNYCGPEQHLKPLQNDRVAHSSRTMLNLLTGDICLEKLFRN